jgi:hypothetical protein
VAAARAFLQQEIAPMLTDHRLKFRALIAANVLAVVERELEGEEDRLRVAWARVAALEPGESVPPATLSALRTDFRARLVALCARIRAGEADEGPWGAEVFAATHFLVEEKLRVANPRYLERFADAAGSASGASSP